MAAPPDVRIALIGSGFMGRAHTNAWTQAGRFFETPRRPVLGTIAARNGEALATFAARWGWPRTTTRWRDLAEDETIDLVDVATPNDVHAEQAIAMLEAGKHVACEKPLAGTLSDARAMRDAARAADGAGTFVWFNYRRCPALAYARQLVASGRLGRIRHVRARYLQSWGGPGTPLVWRFRKARAGSGAHGDLNAHVVDMARFLLQDEIAEVGGALARTFVEERPLPDAGEAGGPRTGRSDVDDAVLFLATFEGGAVASFEASRLAHGHLNDNAIEVDGEHGSLRFAFEDMNVLGFYDATEERGTAGWRRVMCTSADDHPWVGHWWPEGHVLGYEHGFVNMAADVLGALGGAAPPVPLPDFEDAYRTQRVLEAALLSAEHRCAIPLAEVR